MTLRAFAASAALAIGVVAATQSWAATTVFHDDFDRGGSVFLGNGWFEVERGARAVGVRSNRAVLSGTRRGGGADAGMVSSTFDVSGYDQVSVSFDWAALRQNRGRDRLYLSYTTDADAGLDDSSAWTTLFGKSVRGSKKSRPRSFTESLTLDLLGAQSLKFMVWTDVSEGKKGRREGFMLDNFIVTGLGGPLPEAEFLSLVSPFGEPEGGVSAASFAAFAAPADQDAPVPTPVPAALPLMLAALGGLGYMARRRKV